LVTFAVTEYEPFAVPAGAVICSVTDVVAPGASGTELVEYTLHPVGADADSANVEAEQAEWFHCEIEESIGRVRFHAHHLDQSV
jgi:hypothetical protein